MTSCDHHQKHDTERKGSLLSITCSFYYLRNDLHSEWLFSPFYPFLPLQGLWQLVSWPCFCLSGCDLLENSYLCKVFDNSNLQGPNKPRVVICLRILTFARSLTTYTYWCACRRELWFAWEFLPLQGLWQPSLVTPLYLICCDLLENSYLCKVFDNPTSGKVALSLLWFAWEFLPLQGLWQQGLLRW